MFDGMSVNIPGLLIQNFIGVIALVTFGVIVVMFAVYLLNKLYIKTVSKDISELISTIKNENKKGGEND